MRKPASGPLPRGEYIAELVEVGVEATPLAVEDYLATFCFEVCEGKYSGCRFRACANLDDIDSRDNFYRVAAIGGAGYFYAEEDIDACLGKRFRISIWRLTDEPIPLALAWACQSVEEGVFRPIEKTQTRGGFVGQHLAMVTHSQFIKSPNYTDLLLRFMVLKNKKRMDTHSIHFRVFQSDAEAEWRERVLVQSVANAVGAYEFDDTEQLHDKVFAITMWKDTPPMIFTCTPATDAEKQAFRQAVGNKWAWLDPRRFPKGNGGGSAA
jgi:hypothetical protein